MKQLSRVVWSEGMYLGPHHFQVQSRYFEDSIRFSTSSLWYAPWGLIAIKLDAEVDATDQLEFPEQNPSAVQSGIAPQLAALETLLYPSSGQLIANNALQAVGTLEIAPLVAPLTLFVWSKQRVVPVRITDCSIVEEAFDPQLNPIRAKVSLSMRVLSIDDLGFSSKGGSLFMIYQQNKERLAQAGTSASLPALGLTGIP